MIPFEDYLNPNKPPAPAGRTKEQVYGAIADTYSGAFGRGAGQIKPEEYSNWARETSPGIWDFTTPNWQTDIYNSQEAQLYRGRQNAGLPGLQTQTGGAGSGDWKSAGEAWLASGGRTVDDLRRFFAARPEYGATFGGSKGDKVTIGGRTFDMVESAGTGGIRGIFNDITEGGGGGEFSDPWGSRFESEVNKRLTSLGIDPSRYSLDEYIKRLTEADTNKQTNMTAFVDQLKSRVADLQKPAYTDADDSVIRAKAFDQLERRRNETKKNRREDIYARGFAPTSGIAYGADQAVDTDFEQARTGIESDILHSSLDETNRRKDQATGLQGLIEQALSGGDLASLQFLAQKAQLEDSQIADKNNREKEILATLGLPLDLVSQRQQLTNQTLGMGGNPSNIMSSILGMMQYGQNNQQFGQQQSNNNMAGLGQILQILLMNR